MGWLQRLFGKPERSAPTKRELAAERVEAQAEDIDAGLVEFEVHGESYRQDALAALAGPKRADGKQVLVGVTLRCEPDNTYDVNAVRVEVMGQLVGYIGRDQAVMVSPAMQQACGGALEARGLIVGGWRDSDSEGSYGIRVWVTGRDTNRLGIQLAPKPVVEEQRIPTPTLPGCAPGERRLSPTQADIDAERWGSRVTVVGEEHYQDAVIAALPEGWDRHSCPVLVELDIARCNPHSKHDTPCVEARIARRTVGFFTPAMTERYAPLVEAAKRDGLAPTAVADVHLGEKGGATFWRVKAQMQRAT